MKGYFLVLCAKPITIQKRAHRNLDPWSAARNMSFRPAGSDHAIVGSSFMIGLDDTPVGDAVQALKAQKNAWADALPAVRELRQLEVRPDGTPNVRNSPAVDFAFLRPDGTPTWALRFDRSDILVECTLYTRWKQVWAQTSSLLSQAMSVLSSTGVKARSFSIQVTDRFESDVANDKASTIFSDDAPIDPRVRDSRMLWHQHVGWLEATSSGELLHNVNIDVLPKDADGRTIGRIVSLLHLQRLKFTAPIAFDVDEAKNAAHLGLLATEMHQRNKALLRSTLSDAVQSQIRLDGK